MTERLTEKAWRNLDPWECCGQDNYCKRDCHEAGGCIKGCKVPKIYDRLAIYEDTNLTPAEIAAMQEENKKDYKDMRRFQGEYIRLTQENERLKEAVLTDAAGQAELMSEIATLTKALEMALIPNSTHSCPSHNFKIAVECQNGWKADKKVCLKCWTDYYINQAHSTVNSKEGKPV